MKKISVILICCFCLLFAACQDNESTPTDADSVLKLGDWGKSQELSFSSPEEGKVYVVNEKGDKVLDVSEYPRTDILGDEFTGETRLIKTYSPAGVEEIVLETEATEEVETYRMNYYDPFGYLLAESSECNLVSISGAYGFDLPLAWNAAGQYCQIVYLPTGEALPGHQEAYLTNRGIVLEDENCIFYDDSFQEIQTKKHLSLRGFPAEDSLLADNDMWWSLYYDFSSLKDSYGKLAEFYEWEEEERVEQEYYDLVNRAKPAPQRKDSLLVYTTYDSSGFGEDFGLIDENGEIVIENAYEGFAYCGSDSIVAFGEEKTDLYDLADYTVIKSIPLSMIYYDGTNSIVKEGEQYYLGDAEGNALTEGYYGIYPLDMKDEGMAFYLDLWGTDDVSVVDTEGNTLYQLPFAPSLIYVDTDLIAVRSTAGFYTIHTDGTVQKAIRLWEGYRYDEATNTIVYEAPQ